MNIAKNWIDGIKHHITPNCDQRKTQDINLLVIHNISLPPNQFGGKAIDQFFLNKLDENAHPFFKTIRDLKVSAHFVIDRKGEIIQYVALDKRAWHAGVSSFQGIPECNDYSIGIELEGADHIPYTDIQYTKLQHLTQLIQKIYPKITAERIVGHSDIAPTRKTDPGASFDWLRYKKNLTIPT